MPRPSLPPRANALRVASPRRAAPPQYMDRAVRPPVAIHREDTWRRPAALDDAAPDSASTIASRWTDLHTHTRDQHADTNPAYHMIGIAVRPTDLAIRVGGNIVHDGPLAAGALHVSGPGQRICGTFRAPCDFLHLHVRNSFLAGCGGESHGLATDLCFLHDPVIEQLGHALLAADAMHGGYCALYAEGIAQAIITRLLDLSCYPRAAATPKPTVALPNWRLKRAAAYIEAHLAETITLTDLAASAGLTRMHFAAQFRAATGFRPHEYLLRQRVERAQHLLDATNAPLAEIALSVGFQTQPHFTTVFKRFTGETPCRWRQRNGQGCLR